MKKAMVLIAAAATLASGLASADEVLEVHEDRAVGGGFGGLSGFMLGAAAGGPVGALVGGGIGYLMGQGAQQLPGSNRRCMWSSAKMAALRAFVRPMTASCRGST